MTPLTVGTLLVVCAQVAVLAVGYRRENTAAVVNTVAALVVALLPPALAWVLGVDAGEAAVPTLTFWAALAGFLHCLGMLGCYESIWWWDHLTHTLSAALVASLLYAWLLVAGPGPEGVASTIVVAGTLLGTLALGALWEAGELLARAIAERYDIEPVLVHYGWRDTGFDLLFDVVGAALVVILDPRLFVATVESVVRVIGIA